MPALTEELREQIRQACTRFPSKQAATLPALHLVHEAQRCVSTEAIVEIAALLDLHPSEVHDTMTFYGFFRDEQHPIGQQRLWVCRSISCALRGGEELLTELCERLHVHPGQTTQDGKVTALINDCSIISEDAKMQVQIGFQDYGIGATTRT